MATGTSNQPVTFIGTYDGHGSMNAAINLDYQSWGTSIFDWIVMEKTGGMDVYRSGTTVSNSRFVNGYRGALWARVGTLVSSVFLGNNMGLYLSSDSGNTTIERNNFSGNESGIYILQGSNNHPVIRYNTVVGNQYGVVVQASTTTPSSLSSNNIYGNQQYNVRMTYRSESTNQLTGNWWGTTVASEISAGIYDYYDDISLSRINFEPFSLVPISGAPTALPTATPTMTPTANLSIP